MNENTSHLGILNACYYAKLYKKLTNRKSNYCNILLPNLVTCIKWPDNEL